MKKFLVIEVGIIVVLTAALLLVYFTMVAPAVNNNQDSLDDDTEVADESVTGQMNVDESENETNKIEDVVPAFVPVEDEFVEYQEDETPPPVLPDTTVPAQLQSNVVEEESDTPVFVPVEDEFVEYQEDETPPPPIESTADPAPAFVPVEDEFVVEP